MTPDAEQILHYLTAARAEQSITPERPIWAQSLARKFGLDGVREVKAIIRELREDGSWIGKNAYGYFLCLTWDEAHEGMKQTHQHHETKEQLKLVK